MPLIHPLLLPFLAIGTLVSFVAFVMASFPLLCNICPKQPKFSDISHLLTHVASKGHLSHYFKAQVRSREEPSIRDRLDTYDRWYDKNQLEKLLSQRMILKDTKVANSKKRPVSNRHSTSAPSIGATTAKRKRTETPSAPIKEEDLLDPQLSQRIFLPSPVPNVEQWMPTSDLASRHRTFVPHMAGYATTSDHRLQSSIAASLQGQYNVIPEQDLQENASTDDDKPDMRRPSSTRYPDPPNVVEFSASPRSNIMLPEHGEHSPLTNVQDETRPMVDGDSASESPKLKGVYWPGMNMFDSASPDAKRKRNQKKDGSILEQMKTTSATVEPTELIFYPGGDLYKTRYISGQVESSPPVKTAIPIKVKRQRSTVKRTVLGELNTNAHKATRKPRVGKLNSRNRRARVEALKNPSSRMHASSNPYPASEYCAGEQQFFGLDDNEIEWRLTAGYENQKPRQKFKIHDDRESLQFQTTKDNCQRFSGSYPFSHYTTQYTDPGYIPTDGLPYLNSGYHPQTPVSPNTVPTVTYRHNNASWNAVHDSYQDQTDKENLQSLLEGMGSMENSVGRFGPRQNTQRYFTTEESRGTDFFDSFPSHMDFGSFNRPEVFGHMLNPLTINFQYPLPRPSPPVFRPTVRSPPVTISPQYKMTRKGGPESEDEDDENSGDETIDDDESE